MIAQLCARYPRVYAYVIETDQTENKADVEELYSLATKSRPTKKVMVFGGLHGIDPTGVPSGQEPVEKTNIFVNDTVVNVAGKRITSFALDDIAMKRHFSGLNFTYKNLGQYTTAGSDMSDEKQAEVVKLIKDYHNSGDYYVLLGWCFSHVWAAANGL